jgi:ATP-dependent DNA helicase MPH1
MSSPSNYWDGEELNSAVLNELAVIEASQAVSISKPIVRKSPPNTVPTPLPLTAADSDDLFDLTFDVGLQDLQNLDAAIERDYNKQSGSTSKSPLSGTVTRSLSGRQTTLLGDVLSPESSPSKKPSSSRRGAQQRKSPTRSVNHKAKKWDHTAFAKTGRGRKVGKGKGKENLDELEGEEDAVEFEQFPAPFIPGELDVQA